KSGDEWLRGDPAGEPADDPSVRLRLPGSISIARALVTAWASSPA
ncbi:MAG: NAD(+) diphosphatase, partial [Williamsia herbipolensis]|nr:NAD(+) diphosphatase [Williamsia herbipolensis]